jgi:hypothetical protein
MQPTELSHIENFKAGPAPSQARARNPARPQGSSSGFSCCIFKSLLLYRKTVFTSGRPAPPVTDRAELCFSSYHHSFSDTILTMSNLTRDDVIDPQNPQNQPAINACNTPWKTIDPADFWPLSRFWMQWCGYRSWWF